MKDYFARVDDAEASGIIDAEQTQALRDIYDGDQTRERQEADIRESHKATIDEEARKAFGRWKIATELQKQGFAPDVAQYAAGIWIKNPQEAVNYLLAVS